MSSLKCPHCDAFIYIPKTPEGTDDTPVDIPPATLEELDRLARAYGWEIGHGAPFDDVVNASDENPFHDPEWRDRYIRPSETETPNP